MYELEDKDEIAAFYEQGSDRAVAVVCTAIVENRLTDLLRSTMRQEQKVLEDLPGAHELRRQLQVTLIRLDGSRSCFAVCSMNTGTPASREGSLSLSGLLCSVFPR